LKGVRAREVEGKREEAERGSLRGKREKNQEYTTVLYMEHNP
jgi:hypothetical protein